MRVRVRRSALLEGCGDGSAEGVLQHLPRHLLQPVFCAYCEWALAGPAQGGHAFARLLEVAPCMDAEILGHAAPAEQALQQDWRRRVSASAQDPALRQSMAEEFACSLACCASMRGPVRRLAL